MKKICSILFVLILLSCGSRKREAEKKLQIKTSNEVLKDNSTINQQKTIDSSSIVYEPIDTAKPMVFDGKEFVNTKITQSTSKTQENTEIKKAVVLEKETKEKIKEKSVEVETSNKAIWFYVFLTIICVAIIYFFFKTKK